MEIEISFDPPKWAKSIIKTDLRGAIGEDGKVWIGLQKAESAQGMSKEHQEEFHMLQIIEGINTICVYVLVRNEFYKGFQDEEITSETELREVAKILRYSDNAMFLSNIIAKLQVCEEKFPHLIRRKWFKPFFASAYLQNEKPSDFEIRIIDFMLETEVPCYIT